MTEPRLAAGAASAAASREQEAAKEQVQSKHLRNFALRADALRPVIWLGVGVPWPFDCVVSCECWQEFSSECWQEFCSPGNFPLRGGNAYVSVLIDFDFDSISTKLLASYYPKFPNSARIGLNLENSVLTGSSLLYVQ